MKRDSIELLTCGWCNGKGGDCKPCSGTGKRPRRMDGYYISFDPTGNHSVDKILGAVACAGKAFHHTHDWDEKIERPYEDHTGGCPEEWIQNAAQEATDDIQSRIEAAVLAERERCAAIAENRQKQWDVWEGVVCSFAAFGDVAAEIRKGVTDE